MSAAPKPKRFKCDHEGCDKAFAQSGHLTRHKRNSNDLSGRQRLCDRVE